MLRKATKIARSAVSESYMSPQLILVRTGLAAFAVVLYCLATNAAGPSSPEDWQKMYAACLEGIGQSAAAMKLGTDFAPKFCGCVRDKIQKIPEAERDFQYPDRLNVLARLGTKAQLHTPQPRFTILRLRVVSAKTFLRKQ